jgi:hypothetical protein
VLSDDNKLPQPRRSGGYPGEMPDRSRLLRANMQMCKVIQESSMMPGHSLGLFGSGGRLVQSHQLRRIETGIAKRRQATNNHDPEQPPPSHPQLSSEGVQQTSIRPHSALVFGHKRPDGRGHHVGASPVPGQGHTTSRVSPLSGSSNYSPL